MRVERELRVTTQDVELFAAASGDRNPLHFDTEFAAETAFGSPLIHGALIAIAMLGAVPDEPLARIRSLQISFSGAMLPGTAAIISSGAIEREHGAWEIRLTAKGRTVARVLARPGGELPAVPMPLAVAFGASPGPMRTAPAELLASELRVGQAFRSEYATGPELDAIARRFGAGSLD